MCAVPPFDAALRYPTGLVPPEGKVAPPPFRKYSEWMLPCTLVSLAGLPAISVPVTLTSADGRNLPIGVQLVGAPGSETELLVAAALLERAVAREATLPPMPIEPREGPH